MICIDGAGTEYFERGSLPNLRWLSENGRGLWRAHSMVPTVTNVNNVSIITGDYPEKHGIFANCYYDYERKIEVYMENASFIQSESIFEKLYRLNLKSALITAKEKLLNLIDRGSQISLSAENPPEWIVKELGEPPNIYSLEVNSWLLRSAVEVMARFNPNLIYITTTDFAMHKYPPESGEAVLHMEMLDDEIGRLIGDLPESLICVTADHGMSKKKLAIDPSMILKRSGIDSVTVPTVKDRYVPHHSNLSGSAYVYLEKRGEVEAAREILIETEGVEEALTKSEANERFHLPISKVGDILILGGRDYVFGSLGTDHAKEVEIRSHGSLYELEVPILIHGLEDRKVEICENRELTDIVLSWIKGVEANS